MFSAFKKFGKLGALASSVARAWSPLALWPNGASSPGMWIDPPYTASLFSTSAGTTAISAIGTVLDTSNPIGLILDRKGGLALGPELVVNGDFSNGTTGWTVDAGWAISGGKASASGSIGHLYQAGVAAKVVGKTYKYTFTVSDYVSGNVTPYIHSVISPVNFNSNGEKTVYLVAINTSAEHGFIPTAGASFSIDNISVREIPGISLSQATATSMPVASARSNLLKYSEDFSNAAWQKLSLLVSANAAVAPDGATTADLIYPQTTTINVQIYCALPATLAGANTNSIYVKAAGFQWVVLGGPMFASANDAAYFDVVNGVWGTTGSNLTVSATALANGWYRISASNVVAGNRQFTLKLADANGSNTATVNGTNGLYIWGAQANGGAVTSYQRVGAASDYDASAGPTYLQFDGVDDSLASATFAAGTLTSSMDCLIAVRRGVSGYGVLVYQTAGATPFFGAFEPSGVGGSFTGVGAPTTWVDGVQLTGGTAVTAGTLSTALAAGVWHILEYRGLNLSAWTAIASMGYGSGYSLNGALGGIELFASGQDANRDKARAQMAAYFGVTLP